MTLKRTIRWGLAGLTIQLMAAGCDSMSSGVNSFGRIEVTAFTTGPDEDLDGYAVIVDDWSAATISANGSHIVENVRAGSHVVRFDGIATNCALDADRKVVNVTANHVTSVEFVVTCIARNPESPPASTTLHITTVTTGLEQDEDGYRAHVSNFSSAIQVVLPTNGTVGVSLTTGSRYFIALDGIAPNCRIQGNVSPEQVVELSSGIVASVSFAIICLPSYPARLPAGGQLAFVRNGQIHLVNSDGSGVRALTDGPNDCDPSWSPDGRRIAFVRGCHEMQNEIYVMNADGSALTRRHRGALLGGPSWDPDGRRIAFSTASDGSTGVFTMAADFDGEAPEEVINRPGYDAEPSWSPDGKRIAYVSDWIAYDFVYDIYVTPVGGGTISQLTAGFDFWPNLLQYYDPAWSPEGSKLAVTRCPAAFYTCDLSDIVVMNPDGSGVTAVAATRGYAGPTWSRDGTVIAFASGGMLGWIRPGTNERGFIIENGHSPAWRP